MLVIIQDPEGDVARATCYIQNSSLGGLLQVCVDFAGVEVTCKLLRKLPNSLTK